MGCVPGREMRDAGDVTGRCLVRSVGGVYGLEGLAVYLAGR